MTMNGGSSAKNVSDVISGSWTSGPKNLDARALVCIFPSFPELSIMVSDDIFTDFGLLTSPSSPLNGSVTISLVTLEWLVSYQVTFGILFGGGGDFAELLYR